MTDSAASVAAQTFASAAQAWQSGEWNSAHRQAAAAADLFGQLDGHELDVGNAHLLDGRALLDGGRHADALRAVQLAAGVLRAVATPISGPGGVLYGQALGVLGSAREALGDYVLAAVSYRLALHHALHQRHPALIATAATRCAILCKYTGRYRHARQYYQLVEQALTDPAAGSPHAHAALQHNLGGLAHAAGHHEQAREHAQAALRMRETMQPADPIAIAIERSALAPILIDLGHYTDAHQQLTLAAHELAATLGAEHYELAVIHHNQAELAARQHHWPQAITHHEHALDLKRAHHGAGHPDLAITHYSLAIAYHHTHNTPAARQHAQHAITILTSAAPHHPLLADARHLLTRLTPPTP